MNKNHIVVFIFCLITVFLLKIYKLKNDHLIKYMKKRITYVILDMFFLIL